MITGKVTRTGDAKAAALKILSRVRGGGRVEAGFPDSVPADVRQRATFNEFGTSTIPERPFMRTTVADKGQEWPRALAQDLKNVVDDKMTKRQALERQGERTVRDIKATIRGGGFEPNAPSTVKQKGSSRPLIETGEMVSSIDFVVKER